MPDWLPKMFCVDPWGLDTYEKLYQVFCSGIRDARITYLGMRVWFFPTKEDGKETLFWHLTTRNPFASQVPRRKLKFARKGILRDQGAARLPDFRRCERLPWVNPLIHHPADPEVLAWDYLEGDGTVKTYVWIKEHAFVVIMKRYEDNSRRLITSFHVDNEYTRKDFERKYAGRL
jgi:hypothetical protein